MSVDDRRALDDAEPAAPVLGEPGAELLFSAGQSAWLALISVGVLLALGISTVALFLAMSDDDSGGGAAAPAGPATSVEIEASEFAFDPSDVAVVADTDVAVTLDNVGAVEHNWTVLEAGTTIAEEAEFEPDTVVAEVAADPGASESGSVNLAAGSYQVICTIAGHFAAGMEGTLEVTS
ncbi:plastocyanin/azurin family copper-binding protein [Acidimicrobiia bacterium EGI L10123]|uniref:plastocyanin/azurin family copper-binding protein n=1 Tax=Salinilacustrithrix flava TaxID=2957203 RepID=UPI003D7C2A37|nr:plastocyanin/azurin family copper-binding protein [Acidimicrobiia bacterium EGI L10123]